MSGFQRGNGSKESIGIGLKANAPLILNLYTRTTNESGSRNTVLIFSGNPIPYEETLYTLELIAKGVLPPERFVFSGEGAYQHSNIASTGVLELNDYRGKMVRYNHHSDSYREYNGMMQGSIHEYTFLIPK